MSEDKKKPPVVIDGTRVVCPEPGLVLQGVAEVAGAFDWDKLSEEITGSLTRKMAVLQTKKGTDWLKDWLDGSAAKLEREFLYGPSGEPPKPGDEPLGLFRVDIVDPDPEC